MLLKVAIDIEFPEDEVDEAKSKLRAATNLIEKEQPLRVMLGSTMKLLERARARVENSWGALLQAVRAL